MVFQYQVLLIFQIFCNVGHFLQNWPQNFYSSRKKVQTLEHYHHNYQIIRLVQDVLKSLNAHL